MIRFAVYFVLFKWLEKEAFRNVTLVKLVEQLEVWCQVLCQWRVAKYIIPTDNLTDRTLPCNNFTMWQSCHGTLCQLTVCYVTSLPCDILPSDHFAKQQFPSRQFFQVDSFASWHICQLTLLPLLNLPVDHLLVNTLPVNTLPVKS